MSLRNNQRMETDLQSQLAKFGLMREQVKEGTGDTSKYFGLSKQGGDFSTKFTNDISTLENEPDMRLAQFVPSGTQTTNLLQSVPYGKKLSMKDPKTVKAYLRKLLESI